MLKLAPLVQGRESEQRLALSGLGKEWSRARVTKGKDCSAHVAQPKPPGTDLELVVHCTPELFGPLRETLLLERSDPEQRLALLLEGNVQPLLVTTPRFVDLTVAYGEQSTQAIRFEGVLAKRAHPKPQGQIPDFVRVAANPSGGFTILSDSRSVGSHDGTVEFSTGLSEPAVVRVPVRVRVLGTLEVVPNNPYINLRGKGDKSVRLSVSSKQQGFRLLSAKVVSGPFRVEIPRQGTAGGNTAVVVVSVNQGEIEPDARGVAGEIVLTSNDRTEPEKHVRVFGMGGGSIR